jgi:hypothetical protein
MKTLEYKFQNAMRSNIEKLAHSGWHGVRQVERHAG